MKRRQRRQRRQVVEPRQDPRLAAYSRTTSSRSALKDAANNGTFLALAAVGVLAGVAAVRNTGFQLPTLPGMGGGFNEEADDWWAEEQWMDEDGQWETFGQEFDDFGSENRTSAAALRKTKAYKALPTYTKQLFNNMYRGLKAEEHSEAEAVSIAWKALENSGVLANPGASGSRQSTYNKFIAARIPQLTGQGHSSKDAMKVAAQEWRTQKGQ